MIELRALGSLDLRNAGRDVHTLLAQPKRLALLAYLAMARPRGFHRRDVLLALFWPESSQQRARAALRNALHGVRHQLGAGALVGRGDDDVGLAEGAVWCDVVAFEQAVAEQRFEEALELYQGDLLDGFFVSGAPEFEHWVDRERSRLRELAASTAWALAEQLGQTGRDAAAVKWVRWAMEFTPTDESALRRLVLLFYRMGDRAAALHAYNDFAARLMQEYGVRPSADTRKLIETVKASGEVLVEGKAKRPPS